MHIPSLRPGRIFLRRAAATAALLMLACSVLPSRAQTHVTQYTAAQGPVGMALDTVDGVTYLYVADESRGNVYKINVATGATAATFGKGGQGAGPGEFGRPYGVAVDPVSHDLYVAERLNGRIQRINASTGASVLTWGINDAAFNSTGQNTNPPNPSSAQGRFQEPIGIAADSAGNVYVVDHGNNRVQKFRVLQSGGTWTAEAVGMWGSTGSGPGQFDRPYGAALDSAGNLWVADGLNGRVQKFGPSGTHLETVGSKGTGNGQFVIATWVAFDPAGALYVTSTNSDPQNGSAADVNNQWISKFSTSGGATAFVSRFGGTYGSGPGQFRLPFSVAVDTAQKAYVADYYNSRVQVLNLAADPGTGGGGEPTAPTVTSFTVGTSTTAAVNFRIVFSEAVTGVDAADFASVTTGAATATIGEVSGSGTTYTVPVTVSGSGTVQLNLNATGTGIADADGTALSGGATGPTHTLGTSGGGGGGGETPAEIRVVSATTPLPGTYRAGDALVFTVRFSAPVFLRSASLHDVKDKGGKPDDNDKKDDDDDSKDKNGGKGDDDDDDDDADDDDDQGEDNDDDSDEDSGSVFIRWTGVAADGHETDSGEAKLIRGAGKTELTFKYQVHGNDSAPAGIQLDTLLGTKGGARLTDSSGRTLTAAELTIPWPENPLSGVILARANESNHGSGKGKRGKLVNLSSRMTVTRGDTSRSVTVGFVITGDAEKTVLVRAVGPGLKHFGVSKHLNDTTLRVQDSTGKVLGTNSGWNNDPRVSAIAQQVGAFALAAGARDSALVLALAPGAYTATVTSEGPNGEALIEVYDADAAGGPQLVNLSARGYVGRGEHVIAGFVVHGDEPKRVLIRAVGPGLRPLGVTGTLDNPVLEVRSSTGSVLAGNDDWGTPRAGGAPAADVAAAASGAGAFPLAAGSTDAALITTLNPGAYTALATGGEKAEGAVLVEVYQLSSP